MRLSLKIYLRWGILRAQLIFCPCWTILHNHPIIILVPLSILSKLCWSDVKLFDFQILFRFILSVMTRYPITSLTICLRVWLRRICDLFYVQWNTCSISPSLPQVLNHSYWQVIVISFMGLYHVYSQLDLRSWKTRGLSHLQFEPSNQISMWPSIIVSIPRYSFHMELFWYRCEFIPNLLNFFSNLNMHLPHSLLNLIYSIFISNLVFEAFVILLTCSDQYHLRWELFYYLSI